MSKRQQPDQRADNSQRASMDFNAAKKKYPAPGDGPRQAPINEVVY